LEELPLLFQHLRDPALDRVLADEALDENRLLLTDAVGAVDRLVLDGGVPPAVEEEDVVHELQVQADAAGAVAHQDDLLVAVRLELIEDRLAFALWNLAVILHRPVRRQRLGQRLERLDPLREDERLAVAVSDLVHVGQELLELGALAGARVEVANLLEPKEQLED